MSDRQFCAHSRQAGSAKSKLGVSAYDGSLSIVNTEKRAAEKALKDENDARIKAMEKKQEKTAKCERKAALKKLRNDVSNLLSKQPPCSIPADIISEEQKRAIERRKQLNGKKPKNKKR